MFVVATAEKIVAHAFFQKAVIGMILFSALLLGVETDFAFREQHAPLLHTLDRLVLGFFILEIALKITALGRSPLHYFRDGWNLLDFLIVLGCLIPSSSNALAVFRLVRVLRILRLVTALPKLRLIVNALLKSIPSMGSVSVLLFIHFYTFAVLGVFLFGLNDPVHFGNLGRAFLSLFTILTLEGWVEIMRIQMEGCASSDIDRLRDLCSASAAQPVAAVLYFLSFIILGTMIILNLLIGVVVGGMAEAQDSEKEKVPAEDRSLAMLAEIKADLDALKKKLSV
jgi:voltage-gated sodium channel